MIFFSFNLITTTPTPSIQNIEAIIKNSYGTKKENFLLGIVFVMEQKFKRKGFMVWTGGSNGLVPCID